MRFLFVLFLAVALFGCAKNKSASENQTAQKEPSIGGTRKSRGTDAASKNEHRPIIVPSAEMSGRVMRVNETGRFVVLTFTEGIPFTDQKLSLYRKGLRVAEIKITSWKRDNNIVADIIAGDAQVNDEVRK